VENTYIWIEAERHDLLAPNPPEVLTRSRYRSGTLGESAVKSRLERERSQHKATVEEYLAEAREHARDIWLSHVVREGLGQLELAILNLTDHNFRDVDVVMEFGGDVWSAFTRFDIDDDQVILPSRPTRWASIEAKVAGVPRVSSGLFFPGLAAPRVDALSSTPTKPPGSSSNSGSTTLHFSSVDVRPEYRHKIGPVHLVASAEYAGSLVHGTWYATAKNVSGVSSGVFTVPVASQPLLPKRIAE
jgi:hypothetical protein